MIPNSIICFILFLTLSFLASEVDGYIDGLILLIGLIITAILRSLELLEKNKK